MQNLKPVKLTGQFIHLEPLAPSHLPDLEKDFEPALFTYYPKPYSNARTFVEENFEAQKSATFLPFAIVLAATGEAIGCAEFSSIDRNNRKLEIRGSWIRPAYQRTAANSEAKFLLLKHVFEDLEFERVQFTTNVLNAQSRAALEKIGAKFEGILRNAMILPDGSLRNDAYYSIISSEWASVKAALYQRIQERLERINI